MPIFKIRSQIAIQSLTSFKSLYPDIVYEYFSLKKIKFGLLYKNNQCIMLY